MSSITARTLISDALIELNVYRENQTMSANDAVRGLRMLNRVVGQWNARRLLVPCASIQTVAMVVSQSSYTVGSGGNWNVTRPLRISAANVIINNIDVPLNLRDLQWWEKIRDRTLTGTDPTDIFYNPTSASGFGTAYVWPIPTSTDSIRLFLEQQLSSFADLDIAYTIEDAYEQALVKTLVRDFCGPWRQQLTPIIETGYREAMQIIESNSVNAKPPRIRVNDINCGNGYFDTKLRGYI